MSNHLPVEVATTVTGILQKMVLLQMLVVKEKRMLTIPVDSDDYNGDEDADGPMVMSTFLFMLRWCKVADVDCGGDDSCYNDRANGCHAMFDQCKPERVK